MSPRTKSAGGSVIAPLKFGEYLTTEQLGEAMIWTARQMTQQERAQLRRQLNYSVLTKAEKRRIN